MGHVVGIIKNKGFKQTANFRECYLTITLLPFYASYVLNFFVYYSFKKYFVRFFCLFGTKAVKN